MDDEVYVNKLEKLFLLVQKTSTQLNEQLFCINLSSQLKRYNTTITGDVQSLLTCYRNWYKQLFPLVSHEEEIFQRYYNLMNGFINSMEQMKLLFLTKENQVNEMKVTINRIVNEINTLEYQNYTYNVSLINKDSIEYEVMKQNYDSTVNSLKELYFNTTDYQHDVKFCLNRDNVQLNQMITNEIPIDIHSFVSPPTSHSTSNSASNSTSIHASSETIYEVNSDTTSIKEDETMITNDTIKAHIQSHYDVLKQWSKMNACRVVYDSDKDGDDNTVFIQHIMNKRHLYFIVIDEENNEFGCYINEKINTTDQFIADSNHFIFSLCSNGRYNTPKQWFSKGDNAHCALCLYKEGPRLFQVSRSRYGSIYICKTNIKGSYCLNLDKSYVGISNISLSGNNDVQFKVQRIFVIQMI